MKRVLTVLAVTLIVAAMLVVMAAPAFADKKKKGGCCPPGPSGFVGSGEKNPNLSNNPND